MNNTSTSHKPLIVALTGSIGSGKSQAAAIFERWGARIIDADRLAREAVLPDTPAFTDIVTIFGGEVITPDGTLNRKQLAQIVFSDTEKRRALEKIIHPRVQALFRERLGELIMRDRSAKMIVYVIPLLFESDLVYDEIDSVVVISAPRELCLKRTIQRDGCSREMAESRYDAQLPIEYKTERADHVIHNDGNLMRLEEQVASLYKTLTGDAK